MVLGVQPPIATYTKNRYSGVSFWFMHADCVYLGTSYARSGYFRIQVLKNILMITYLLTYLLSQCFDPCTPYAWFSVSSSHRYILYLAQPRPGLVSRQLEVYTQNTLLVNGLPNCKLEQDLVLSNVVTYTIARYGCIV